VWKTSRKENEGFSLPPAAQFISQVQSIAIFTSHNAAPANSLLVKLAKNLTTKSRVLIRSVLFGRVFGDLRHRARRNPIPVKVANRDGVNFSHSRVNWDGLLTHLDLLLIGAVTALAFDFNGSAFRERRGKTAQACQLR
jgi:hypothetical protein